MTFFGNLALLLAFIGYVSLVSMAGKPTPSGDYGVGYAFALLFAYAALAIGISITTSLLYWKGGFNWVSEKSSVRNILIIVGGISVLIFSFFAAMNGDGGAPWIIRILGKYVVVWALPPLLLAGVVLVNSSLQTLVPAILWQWALKSTVLLSVASCFFIIGEWLVNIPISAVQHAKMRDNEETRRHQEFLDQIAKTNAQTELVMILVFTTKYHDPEVRNAALAKIKSNPEWQHYLVSRLQTPWAGEVFSFLADNEVDNKALFPKAIEAGVLEMAKKFKEGMLGTHTFYDGQFYSETEDVLETIAKFESFGVDYAPAVRKLRATLNTRLKPYQQGANLRCIPVLDKWLKKHGETK